jgi:hypothetical protein
MGPWGACSGLGRCKFASQVGMLQAHLLFFLKVLEGLDKDSVGMEVKGIRPWTVESWYLVKSQTSTTILYYYLMSSQKDRWSLNNYIPHLTYGILSRGYPHFFFSNYTIHRRYSQLTHTHPYEYTHVNLIPKSIFEDRAGKSSRLTKSPHALRCRRERRLPLKAQTPLNLEKFAPMGNRTQDLRCYRDSCNY